MPGVSRSEPDSVGRKIDAMDRTFMLVGAVAGLIGVGFGAFGAHGLRERLAPEMLAVFETGVRYQMYHAFAIFVVALALAHNDAPLVRYAGPSPPASSCFPAASTPWPSPALRRLAPSRRLAEWRSSSAGRC